MVIAMRSRTPAPSSRGAQDRAMRSARSGTAGVLDFPRLELPFSVSCHASCFKPIPPTICEPSFSGSLVFCRYGQRPDGRPNLAQGTIRVGMTAFVLSRHASPDARQPAALTMDRRLVIDQCRAAVTASWDKQPCTPRCVMQTTPLFFAEEGSHVSIAAVISRSGRLPLLHLATGHSRLSTMR